MKISIDKLSTSILTVFIKSTDGKVKSGKISLFLYVDRKNKQLVADLPYDDRTLVYEFDMSRMEPKSVGDFSYVAEISDDISTEVSRNTKIYKGAPHHISGAVKKIQSDFKLVAKTHNGSVIYMFKKIPGTQKCDTCWDEDLMASNNSSCEICGGTGKMSYYANPYKSYGAAIQFAGEKYGTQDAGRVMESTVVQMSAPAEFALTTDDMVYYERTGDWYRVKTRTISELQTVPTLQMLVMDLMPSGAPETETAYKLIHKD